MKLTKTLAVALEAVGASIGVAGIVVESITKADIGYVLITGGAVICAVGAGVFAKLKPWK